MAKVRNMVKGNPARLIFAVSVPLMLGNLFQQLYTIVDAQIVGQVDGVSALAALGVASWYYWMFQTMLVGLCQGMAIPVAQCFGAGDLKEMRRYAGNGILLSALLTAFLTAVLIPLVGPGLMILDTPAEVFEQARIYMIILIAGFPVVTIYNLCGSYLRALGNARSPLIAMVIASLLNIALDWWFVAGLRMGVAGAALATVAAQAVSCIYCWFTLKNIREIRLVGNDLKPDKQLCSRLLSLSIPLGAQNVIIGIGGLVVQKMVNSMSVAFIAGYTAASKLYGALEMCGVSYGYAMTTYTGQNLGAGEEKRIRRGVRSGCIIGICTSLLIALIMAFAGKPVMLSFLTGTENEVSEALRVGIEFMRIMCEFMPVLYILHVMRNALQGMGDTLMPMLSGVLEFIMRILSVLLLPSLIGYSGVFWAEVLAWFGADAILIPAYFRRMNHLFPKKGASNEKLQIDTEI